MIRATNHIGISVANLIRSIEFYRKGFGMEVVIEAPFGGEQYERILNLKGAAGKVALLKGGDLQLELFEFDAPVPATGNFARPVCDHGITHFCVEVADILEAYARLEAAGAAFHCPPLDFAGKALATYGRDPDGNVFELLQIKIDGRQFA